MQTSSSIPVFPAALVLVLVLSSGVVASSGGVVPAAADLAAGGLPNPAHRSSNNDSPTTYLVPTSLFPNDYGAAGGLKNVLAAVPTDGSSLPSPGRRVGGDEDDPPRVGPFGAGRADADESASNTKAVYKRNNGDEVDDPVQQFDAEQSEIKEISFSRRELGGQFWDDPEFGTFAAVIGFFVIVGLTILCCWFHYNEKERHEMKAEMRLDDMEGWRIEERLGRREGKRDWQKNARWGSRFPQPQYDRNMMRVSGGGRGLERDTNHWEVPHTAQRAHIWVQ
eukprot:g2220.t1